MGREKIIENLYVQNIMKLLDDSVESIRRCGYKSLLNMTEFQQGFLNVKARHRPCLFPKDPQPSRK